MIEQAFVIGENEAKLRLSNVTSVSGDASIAVIRGEPRMGYELDLKIELTGVDETYFQDFVCEVEITELCDDQSDPESVNVTMQKMLDTNQAQVAKEVIGHSNDCDKLLKVIHSVLKDYPHRQ